jgi:DNA-binding transcriptional LysR family regulator
MHIENLKIFRDLVDNESFSKAAKLNAITQSAVVLERLIGQFLFSKAQEDGGKK